MAQTAGRHTRDHRGMRHVRILALVHRAMHNPQSGVMIIMYAITAQVETVSRDSFGNEYQGSRQVPTFYLDEHVQGIQDELHAGRIAHDVIDPLGILPYDRVHVTAVKLPEGY